MINISNFLTILRFVFIPFITQNILENKWQYALILFLIAIVTDLLDGFFARLINQETDLGALLDPLADKTLLISCYIAILFSQLSTFYIPKWFIILVLLKELCLIIGSFILYNIIKYPYIIKANILGKINTMLQFLFVMFLFICANFDLLNIVYINQLFYLFLYCILILNIFTLIYYFLSTLEKLQFER